MFICFEFKLVFDYIIGFWFTSQNRRAHASSTRKKSYMFMLNVVKELEELSNKNWFFGYEKHVLRSVILLLLCSFLLSFLLIFLVVAFI